MKQKLTIFTAVFLGCLQKIKSVEPCQYTPAEDLALGVYYLS